MNDLLIDIRMYTVQSLGCVETSVAKRQEML